jgi:hypothetical protein
VSNHWLNSELSRRIRSRISSGKLPSDPDAPADYGSGRGANCVCCDRTIADFNIQQTVEMPALSGAGKLPMHGSCFDIWRQTAADMLHPNSSR